MEKTLEYDLGKNKITVFKVVVAGFLGVVSFLTFSYFAFSDRVPKSLQKDGMSKQQIVMQKNNTNPSLATFTHPLYKFSLQYPSNLQTKVQTDTFSVVKITTISFGEYSGKSTPQGDPPFISHASLVITEKVPITISIETFSKLTSNDNPQWSEVTIGGIVGKKVSYTCENRKCGALYITKGTTAYRFASSAPQYTPELVTILKNFRFIN